MVADDECLVGDLGGESASSEDDGPAASAAEDVKGCRAGEEDCGAAPSDGTGFDASCSAEAV